MLCDHTLSCWVLNRKEEMVCTLVPIDAGWCRAKTRCTAAIPMLGASIPEPRCYLHILGQAIPTLIIPDLEMSFPPSPSPSAPSFFPLSIRSTSTIFSFLSFQTFQALLLRLLQPSTELQPRAAQQLLPLRGFGFDQLVQLLADLGDLLRLLQGGLARWLGDGWMMGRIGERMLMNVDCLEVGRVCGRHRN